MHAIVHCGGMVPKAIDSLAQLASYLGAIVHDFEHGGGCDLGCMD